MKKRNIALIGFRTTGKSLTGKILATQLDSIFIDMDDLLVAAFGEGIDSWVRSHGWESFRKAESDLLGTLCCKEELVVATGGGIILDEKNREMLRQNFHVVWLQASPETIYSRLLRDPKTSSQRPPLTDLPIKEEIDRLLEDRYPLYAQTADLILESDNSPARELASRIKAWFSELPEKERSLK